MLILFDHSTPRGVARVLPTHTVMTAYERGWERLGNGDLITAAEEAGFDLILTADRRIRYQQNLTDRRITIIVLTGSTKWSQVRQHLERVATIVNEARTGTYVEIAIPFP